MWGGVRIVRYDGIAWYGTVWYVGRKELADARETREWRENQHQLTTRRKSRPTLRPENFEKQPAQVRVVGGSVNERTNERMNEKGAACVRGTRKLIKTSVECGMYVYTK